MVIVLLYAMDGVKCEDEVPKLSILTSGPTLNIVAKDSTTVPRFESHGPRRSHSALVADLAYDSLSARSRHSVQPWYPSRGRLARAERWAAGGRCDHG